MSGEFALGYETIGRFPFDERLVVYDGPFGMCTVEYAADGRSLRVCGDHVPTTNIEAGRDLVFELATLRGWRVEGSIGEDPLAIRQGNRFRRAGRHIVATSRPATLVVPNGTRDLAIRPDGQPLVEVVRWRKRFTVYWRYRWIVADLTPAEVAIYVALQASGLNSLVETPDRMPF